MIVCVLIATSCNRQIKEHPTEKDTSGVQTEAPTDTPTEKPSQTIECEHTYTAYCDTECDLCGEIRSVESNHVYIENSRAVATCISNGYITYVCSDCADISVSVIQANGHSESSWLVQNSKSCVSDGLEYKVCVTCDEKLDERIISATGHKWGEEKIVSPTCTLGGYTTRTCTVCMLGEQYDKTAPLGHSADEWITDRGATCTLDGISHVECVRCNATIATDKVNATGHNWRLTLSYDQTKHWQECAECLVISEKQEHNVIEGQCNCGYGDPCEHNGGIATCSSRAICVDCSQEYGEYLPQLIDSTISPNKTYVYSIIPIYENKPGKAITMPAVNPSSTPQEIPKDWWRY